VTNPSVVAEKAAHGPNSLCRRGHIEPSEAEKLADMFPGRMRDPNRSR
jgi:hypothetical protein